MAPLPPNSTSRLFVDYVTGSGTLSKAHTCMLRSSFNIADHAMAQEVFTGLLNLLGTGNFRSGWRVNQVRFAEAGMDFSVPVPMTPAMAGFIGTQGGSSSPLIEATEDSFVGRSRTSGRRAKIALYRASTVPEGTFRISGGPGGFPLAITNAVNWLNDKAGDGELVCIDQSVPRFALYLNQNVNSYWESKQRT